MMVWGRANPPGLYKWLTARWMLRAGPQYPRPADGVQTRQARARHAPPRMPLTPAKETVALPQLNIVSEYDSKLTVATKRQMRPAIQTKDRSP